MAGTCVGRNSGGGGGDDDDWTPDKITKALQAAARFGIALQVPENKKGLQPGTPPSLFLNSQGLWAYKVDEKASGGGNVAAGKPVEAAKPAEAAGKPVEAAGKPVEAAPKPVAAAAKPVEAATPTLEEDEALEDPPGLAPPAKGNALPPNWPPGFKGIMKPPAGPPPAKAKPVAAGPEAKPAAAGPGGNADGPEPAAAEPAPMEDPAAHEGHAGAAFPPIPPPELEVSDSDDDDWAAAHEDWREDWMRRPSNFSNNVFPSFPNMNFAAHESVHANSSATPQKSIRCQFMRSWV